MEEVKAVNQNNADQPAQKVSTAPNSNAPKTQNNSNTNLDRKIEDKVNNLSKSLDDKILAAINKKTEAINKNAEQVDIAASLSDYFNVKSICIIDYADYQLIALVSTLLACIIIKVLDVFPVLNIPILIGYLLYILIVIIKEKIWNLMVR